MLPRTLADGYRMWRASALPENRGRLAQLAALGQAPSALIVGCCVLWGLNQVATKVALVEIPPLMQAAARSVGAALLVALWARMRGIPLTGLAGGLASSTAVTLSLARQSREPQYEDSGIAIVA